MTNWIKVETSTDAMWPEVGQELKEKDSVEGRYVELRSEIGDNKSNIHVFEGDDGKTIGVWGSYVLDGKMSRVAIGKMCKIVFLGRKESKNKGRNPYKDYDVFYGEDTPSENQGGEITKEDLPF
jgi:hypothetical protein